RSPHSARKDSANARAVWGTERCNALRIIERALNLKDPKIYDVDDKDKRVLNKDATIAAQEKAQKVKDEFSRWVWGEPSRAVRLARIYNDKFNEHVTTLDSDMSDYVQMFAYQKGLPTKLSDPLSLLDCKSIHEMQVECTRICEKRQYKTSKSDHPPATAAPAVGKPSKTGNGSGNDKDKGGKTGDRGNGRGHQRGNPRPRPKPKCKLCDGEHYTDKCSQFEELVNSARNKKPNTYTVEACHAVSTNHKPSCSRAVANSASRICSVPLEDMENLPPFSAIIDSGCSDHMTPAEHYVDSSTLKPTSTSVTVATDHEVPVEEKGDMPVLAIDDDGNKYAIDFKDTLVVPGLNSTLISVACCIESGMDVHFKHTGHVFFLKKGKVVVRGRKRGRLFYLEGKSRVNDSANGTALTSHQNRISHELLHKRMGHAGWPSLKKTAEATTGLELEPVGGDETLSCEHCIIGKFTRLPFEPSTSPRYLLGQYLHSDLCGPLTVSTMGGGKYILTFIEDNSRCPTVRIISNKQAATIELHFNNFMQWLERRTEKKLLVVRTDGGKEYLGEMKQRLIDSGIDHHTTTSHTSQQNGVAERYNLTILDKTRSTFSETGIPLKLWGELVMALTHVHQLTTYKDLTPIEQLTGRKPDLRHLRTLGCLVYFGIPAKGRSKLGPRGTEGFLVGYGEPFGTKGYRIWDPATDTIVVSRDVIFKEDVLYKDKYPGDASDPELLKLEDEDSSEFLVEKILGEQEREDGLWYRVKWLGYK
ncbi:hypothetical protein EON64_14045, partial [archaeon]